MLAKNFSNKVGGWERYFESFQDDRCDFDILLKDEWRHKIVVRDNERPHAEIIRHGFVAEGSLYEGFQRLASGRDRGFRFAIVLAVCHQALAAYGHGARTVLASIDGNAGGGVAGRLLPSIVDHANRGNTTCAEAIEVIADDLCQASVCPGATELLGKGLFDAVVRFVSGEGALFPELPSFPLTVDIHESAVEGQLRWTISYAADLFEYRVITGVLDVIRQVLEEFIYRTEKTICALQLLSVEQRRQLDTWNATDGDFPSGTRLESLFEEAVRRSPDKIAIIFDDVRLTYRELNERCNRAAHWLLNAGSHRSEEEIVAFHVDRSHLAIAAILGLWKAGLAYVPIDPSYPAERILFSLKDTKAKRLIANARYMPQLADMVKSAGLDIEIVELESLFEEAGAVPSTWVENPALRLLSSQVAYVTYTSGTTGFPKGVSKEHRMAVNSITDLSVRYGMQGADSECVALFSAPVFEPFLRQTLIALINSHALVVVPEKIGLDPVRFQDFVAYHGITYLNGTRSVLQQLDLRNCPALKRMLLVGEEMTASGLLLLRERFAGEIINEYAFTETAFVTAIKVFAPGVLDRPNRSIGRPLRNVRCYVLGRDLKRVPIGAIGELYIGGEGVARGYLNRDDLSAERFLSNPYRTETDKSVGANERIYRTGDLARMLPDGELEFMGRSDFQLKLNGVRIEPGEIEARVLEFPDIRQCVVVPKERSKGEGNRYLVGYFVAKPGCAIREGEVLDFLAARLIRSMVPARLLQMDRFPVNINGKVDRGALPEVPLRGSANHGEGVDRDGSGLYPIGDGCVEVIRELWSGTLGIPAEAIDTRDDFFRLGGHSVACIQLLTAIWNRLRIAVTVEDFYRLKTLGSLAAHLDGQMPQPAMPTGDPVAEIAPPIRGGGSFSANSLQQGLVYQSLKGGPDSGIYVMQSVYRYHCPIDSQRMQRAWQRAQEKYPSLRLSFAWKDEVVQIVEAGGDLQPDWRYYDFTAASDPAQGEARLCELREQDRIEPYTLSKAGLFRVYLVKLAADEYALLFSCHHIIMDGWSLPILHNTVHGFYSLLAGGEIPDPVVDTAYERAQHYLQEHCADHRAYWSEQISRISEPGDLSGLLRNESCSKHSLSGYDAVTDHKTRVLDLGGALTARLKAKATDSRVTLHSILQFVWHRLLHAIGGGCTTVVGTIVSGRSLPIDGIETSVGLFINTLPLIVNHDGIGEQSIQDAVVEIQCAVNAMNSRSAVELGRLDCAGAKRRLFDTLLVLENYPEPADAHGPSDELPFEALYDSDRVDYPIAVVAREQRGSLLVSLWYAGELFEEDVIGSLLDSMRALFEQVAAGFRKPVRDLEFITPAIQARFDEWNRTETPFDENLTLATAFQAAAARWPDQVAVAYRETELSYAELNERANQLAHHLQQILSLQPDDVIALVLNKSEWMIIAILAVWKAGAALVPIDPDYPDERIAYMLDDAGARLTITDNIHLTRIQSLPPGGQHHAIAIQQLSMGGLSRSNPEARAASRNLAYAIYTSGTTGKPKAVLIEHRGVINLHRALEKLFSLNRSDGEEAILSFSNYVFDHFFEQMLDALLSGQKLVVLDDELRADRAGLCRYMRRHAVTYLSGTPSVLSMYEYTDVPSLRRIDAIGEDFTFPVFNRIRETFGGLIINGYGPTEISITSHKRLYHSAEYRRDKSIGFPVANTKCYVLNESMKPVPIGGIGELHIGGVGVARGYLGRPSLNDERFLRNPFQTTEEKENGRNGRIYKTGDLVRWLPNGELEYLGRRDMQVKIRGIRVELGEIEAVLSSYSGVSRALVVAREHHREGPSAVKQKYLVGFYLADEALEESHVLRWMKDKLPEHLVPVRLLRISEIPVTPSGKLDVARLPEAPFSPEHGRSIAAPSNDSERELCRIWAQVLELPLDHVGTQDEFFALGGDSFRAIRLAQLIVENFERQFSVACVFDHPSVEAQARYLQAHPDSDEALPSFADIVLPALAIGEPPVSHAQERLLFIDDFVGGTAAYNIPFVIEFALDQAVSREVIRHALCQLMRRHGALRTLLRGERDGLTVQRVLDAGEALARFKIDENTIEGRTELDRALAAEAEHIFQLDSELPVRALLWQIAGIADVGYLSLVFHHTCFDGWSWTIFRQEFQSLIGGLDTGSLPALPMTYADFAIWQRRHLSDSRLAALRHFWEATLDGAEPLNLPVDFQRPVEFDYRGREINFEIDAQTLGSLKSVAKDARVSFFSLLIGAFGVVMKHYSGRNDIVVGVPAANRGRPEFAGVVGFFANLLVMRMQVEESMPLPDYLRSVGDVVLQAQKFEEFPFEQVIKSLQVERDTSRHPLVQVAFSFVDDTSKGGSWSLPFKPYTPQNGGHTSTKFDLSVTVTQAGGLTVNFTYATALWALESIRAMGERFLHILQALSRLARSPSPAAVSDLLVLDETERKAILGGTTERVSGFDKKEGDAATLATRFEMLARLHPDRPAVVCAGRSLSYAGLNGLANRIVHATLDSGEVMRNDIVALVMDKSEWMVATILAVWKLGAAYLPIDPEWPDDRVKFMLEDAGVRLLMADAEYAGRLQNVSTGVERILCPQALSTGKDTVTDLERLRMASDLAYVIFTSGTTGRPKGVLVRHCSAIEFSDRIAALYFGRECAERQSILFLANYVFDFSVEQLGLSIIAGHTLVIPDDVPLADARFCNYANCHGVSYLSGTPTQLQQIDLSRLDHLRTILVAGEPFKRHHYEKIRRAYRGPLFNAYGTTETTVYNTVRLFEHGDTYRNALGQPLPGTQLFILDGALRLLPSGAEGELCIAGDCISAGYLNRPQLTRERFVPNPYRTEEDRREGRCAVLYRTGDIVRRSADGELEFVGRNDLQVKINGIRVELGEVEASIAEFPAVHECAVVTREDGAAPGATRLVAFYVSHCPLDERELTKFLRGKLVASMVPSVFVRVEGPLPQTVTGKLDRSALKKSALPSAQNAYAAPLSRIEARLREVWADLLDQPSIGVDDDFFRSGGDSITALQLVSMIQREFGRRVGVKMIFECPTIRAFSKEVLDSVPHAALSAEAVAETGTCEMLPIQRWFFAKPLSDPGHWNQYFAIRTPVLDVARLQSALNALIAYHDAFRLRFRVGTTVVGSQPEQFYADSAPEVSLAVMAIDGLNDAGIEQRLDSLHGRFDLETGPLFRVVYLHGFSDHSARIWLAMHHLVTDVFSWRIIARDLEILYHGGSLESRECSYRQWAEAVAGYKPAQAELELWNEYSQSILQDPGAIAAVESVTNRIQFSVAESDTARLLGDGNRLFDTQPLDLMLAAMAAALSAVSGTEINYLALEGHGREDFDGAPNVQDTVGWFTTMHPLAVVAKDDVGASILATKASRACIPRRGIGYGSIHGSYGTPGAPMPGVTFNYLGRFVRQEGRASASRQGGLTRWILDSHLSGTSKSSVDSGTDRGALDVTARCIGEELVIEVESRMGVQKTEQFVVSLKRSLEAIAACTSMKVSERRHGMNSSGPIHLPHDFEPYILVNEKVAGTKLFVLPPGEGGAESYLGNIARQLPHLELVLFNNIQLHRPMPSYEALAQYYLKFIRDLQPTGPYHLLGWSFGGVLSFEIARQLSIVGESVENLLLVDSFFDIRKAASGIGLADSARNLLDPINYDYQPAKAGIEQLRCKAGRIILYKATELIDEHRSDEQKRLFGYYARSQCNNLDSLLPPNAFSIEALAGKSHFSWIKDKELVESLGVRIQSAVLGAEELAGIRH